MNIQWYPGHMTKSIRMMTESLKLVDVVVELLDARIPGSSKNPDIDNLAKKKKRILVLNKIDLANPASTEKWKKYYEEQGFKVIQTDSIAGTGLKNVTSAAMELMAETIARDKARGRIFRPVRAMIAGIPNVGKSAFVNKYVGRAAAKTGDKPGVTRGKQWIRIKKDFELLDTPGILWPKFEDPKAGLNLAFTGAINDNILDITGLCTQFIGRMRVIDPKILENRYKLEISETTEDHVVLEEIAKKRGFIMRGSEPDIKRCAHVMLDEFRGGKLGKITLELPEDFEKQEEKA